MYLNQSQQKPHSCSLAHMSTQNVFCFLIITYNLFWDNFYPGTLSIRWQSSSWHWSSHMPRIYELDNHSYSWGIYLWTSVILLTVTLPQLYAAGTLTWTPCVADLKKVMRNDDREMHMSVWRVGEEHKKITTFVFLCFSYKVGPWFRPIKFLVEKSKSRNREWLLQPISQTRAIPSRSKEWAG